MIEKISVNEIQKLILEKNVLLLRDIFEVYNNVDLAKTLSECPIDDILFVFKTMKTAYTSEIFSYFEADLRQSIVTRMTSGEIKSLLDNLMSDDVVDFLEELPPSMIQEVLKHTSKEKRYYINQMLNFKPETAGSIMGIEFLSLKDTDTVKSALEKIRKEGKNAQTINYIYVVDVRDKLVGTLRLKDIIISNEDALIQDIMELDLICANCSLNQEEVANLFKEYDINAIPVVNDDNYLIGIITVDDIIDVMEEETTIDMQIMAGVVPLEETYLQTSVLSHTLRRCSWLWVLLILSVFTGILIDSYQDSILSVVPILSSFIPMLMNVGGVAGGQTTTLIIRSLSVGEIKLKDTLKVLFKEFRVTLLIGIILAFINFIWLSIQIMVGLIAINYVVAFLVCLSLFLVVLIANLIGILLPMAAKLIKLDPALFASPLLTNIMDIVAIVIYLSFAILLKDYIM